MSFLFLGRYRADTETAGQALNQSLTFLLGDFVLV
jgi:hypothetical protein